MDNINWQDIADAIRERRFEDIMPEVWNQVADEIETFAPKKKGTPPKPKHPKYDNNLTPQENGAAIFKHLSEWQEWKRTRKPSNFDKCFDYGLHNILEHYEAFHTLGTTSEEAYKKVAELLRNEIKFTADWKSVESLVTAIRKENEFQYEEAKAADEKSKARRPK